MSKPSPVAIVATKETGEGLFIAFSDGTFALYPTETLYRLKEGLQYSYDSPVSESGIHAYAQACKARPHQAFVPT